jgi:galactofuranose transport system substrate-binding protein
MTMKLSQAKSRTFAVILLSSLLVLVFSACNSSNASGGTHPGCTPGSNTSLPALSHPKIIGWSENSLDGAWRNAEESSMEQAASSAGYQLIKTNANNSDDQQVQDINTLINDKVDALVIAPLTENAESAAIVKARQACIPVFLVDRDANHSLASPGQDYVTFLGSDFEKQGQQGADLLITAVGGPNTKGQIIELQGTTGASPAILRSAGFDEELKAKAPGLTIVAKQDANFDRATAQTITANLIQQYPGVIGVFGANDEEAIGAISALKAAGKKPGQDIFVTSIDGTKDATNLILSGEQYALVTSDPHFGPITMQAIQDYASGKSLKAWIVVNDKTILKADGSATSYLSSGAF